jgi:hypothetical protein
VAKTTEQPRPSRADVGLPEEPPEDLAKVDVDEIAAMTLPERIQAIREKVAYIRKTETGAGTPYKSAVAHAAVLEKLRPWLVKYRILWWPEEVEHLAEWRDVYPTRDRDRLFVFTRIKTTTVFVCADRSDGEIRVQIITDGMDDQDKGGPKASTYADKLALVRLFNLESGDDPDFDRAAEVGLDEKTQERINRIRDLIKQHPHYKDDPAAYERGVLVKFKQQTSRYRVPDISGLPDEELDRWAETLQREIGELGHA